MMLKIGEFARIAQVSIVTLRHYDQCGLLKPSALDAESGYRYYTFEQLPRLNRILTLKDLGFSLAQIAQLLENDLSLEQLHGMFALKQAQIQQGIEAEQARLQRISARLRLIEQEDKMAHYDIRIKQVEPLLVASLRQKIPIAMQWKTLYQTLSIYLEEQGAQILKPVLVIWHSRHKLDEHGMSIDAEVAIPLAAPLAGSEQVVVHTLPAVSVASTVHTGDDLSLGLAHAALHRWLLENEYQMVGPVRQLHLHRDQEGTPGKHVTEMQFPIS